MKDFKVKVVKPADGFNKALKEGFAVNTHDCSPSELWLCMPHRETLVNMVNHFGWTTVSDIVEC